MNKQEFLESLRKGLNSLPRKDTEEQLAFYSEIIDDRIEEGLSEEDAVLQIGTVDEIVSQIIAEIPLGKLIKEKTMPKKKLKVWEIVFLVLGSPLWLSLIIAAFAVALSLYLSLWAVIISFWAVFASLIGSIIGGIASAIIFTSLGNAIVGLAMIAASIVCAGLSIFAFFGCKTATKGILLLTKKLALGLKKCFIKKEEA